MTGLSTIGSISFGIAFVCGKNRVPNPAAGITAFVIFFDIVSLSFHEYVIRNFIIRTSVSFLTVLLIVSGMKMDCQFATISRSVMRRFLQLLSVVILTSSITTAPAYAEVSKVQGLDYSGGSIGSTVTNETKEDEKPRIITESKDVSGPAGHTPTEIEWTESPLNVAFSKLHLPQWKDNISKIILPMTIKENLLRRLSGWIQTENYKTSMDVTGVFDFHEKETTDITRSKEVPGLGVYANASAEVNSALGMGALVKDEEGKYNNRKKVTEIKKDFSPKKDDMQEQLSRDLQTGSSISVLSTALNWIARIAPDEFIKWSFTVFKQKIYDGEHRVNSDIIGTGNDKENQDRLQRTCSQDENLSALEKEKCASKTNGIDNTKLLSSHIIERSRDIETGGVKSSVKFGQLAVPIKNTTIQGNTLICREILTKASLLPQGVMDTYLGVPVADLKKKCMETESAPTPTPADSCDFAAIESKLDALANKDKSCQMCNSGKPKLYEKVLNAAGAAFNVPASMIYAIMLGEGGGPGWPNFWNASDDDIKKWSIRNGCPGHVDMPQCTPEVGGSNPPFGWRPEWYYAGGGYRAVWTAVKVVDPARVKNDNTPDKKVNSPCNFLDAAFAAASQMSQGSVAIPAAAVPFQTSCDTFNLTSNLYRPSSCSAWADVHTARARTYHLGNCPEPGKQDLKFAAHEVRDHLLTQAVSDQHQYSCK
jgi:hypothetical protein